MNFKGHLTGGAAAGAAVVTIVLASGRAAVYSVPEFFESSAFSQNSAFFLGLLFLITVFMSLFPDLDVGSIPQRWFLRASFVALTALFIYDEMEWFAALTFAALLPMLHRHRGWTHFKSAPFIILTAAAVAFEYRSNGLSDFSLQRTVELAKSGWPYILAVVSGHYTHLLLDYRGWRRFKRG